MSLIRPRTPGFTVLLVCTGNICRSAMAERLGRAYLDDLLRDDAGAIEVVSAGTQAVVGSRMHPDSALVLEGFGGEAGDFRARQLQSSHPAHADLVLTMTRAHRRSVLELAPRRLGRTFTLFEAADLLAGLDAAPSRAGCDLADQGEALVRQMAAARSRRQSGADDDIVDPIGRPLEAHQAAGDAIAAALLPVLGRFAALATATLLAVPPVLLDRAVA